MLLSSTKVFLISYLTYEGTSPGTEGGPGEPGRSPFQLLYGPAIPATANGRTSKHQSPKRLHAFPAKTAQVMCCSTGYSFYRLLLCVMSLLLVHWSIRKSTRLRKESSLLGTAWPLPTILTLSVSWPPSPATFSDPLPLLTCYPGSPTSRTKSTVLTHIT